ncbi:MAG: histidine kinase [Chitinophagaceae bacterium]
MKSAWYSKKWVVILLHAAAWVLLFSLPTLLRPSYNQDQPARHVSPHPDLAFLASYIMDITWMGIFYFNALFLIPRFPYKRKYWHFAGIHLVIIAWILIQSSLFYKLLIRPGEHFDIRRPILFNFFIYLFILATSTAYTLIRDKIKADNLAQEKENENLKTELSLLRSQVSPHFMFNVLNNMVSLARKQSDQLEPSLIKLSSLMRYMLYETDEEKVSLEKEIDYLQSYIDLQQQRFGKKVKVTVDMQTMNDQYQVEPMLLIPFVENAFKHGTGLIENAHINIELRAEKNILQFTVSNKFNPVSVEVKDKTSGIGLTNVTRRLNLLYGKRHTLKITRDNNCFVVSLKLNIAE